MLRVQQILPNREQTMIYNKDQPQFCCGIKNEVETLSDCETSKCEESFDFLNGWHRWPPNPSVMTGEFLAGEALESLRPQQQSTSVALSAGSSWHEWTWIILELRLQRHWNASTRYKGHLWKTWFELVALSFSQADTLCTFLSFADSFFIMLHT